MAKVHNKHHKTAPKDAVYIGRGSPWGNPFVIGIQGTRDQVCDRFKKEILPSLDLRPLIGKDLVCFCKPQRCHGDDIIKEVQKRYPDQTEQSSRFQFEFKPTKNRILR